MQRMVGTILEEFATNYVIQGPLAMAGYMICLMPIGGLASAFYRKSDSTLARAPYLFCFGSAYLLLSLAQLPWGKTPQAINAGLAWVLMLTSILGNLAFGFVMGRLAAARSRDAYGHSKAAVLAFIPLLNIWLYFVRSRGGTAAPKSMWLMRGFVGVLVGFLFLGLGNYVVKEAMTQRVRSFIHGDGVAPELLARFLINKAGLEQTLAFYANSVPLPMKVDMVTTLTGLKVHGATMETTYRVGSLWGTMFGVPKDDVTNNLCKSPLYPPLLRAGATLKVIYNDPDGHELANWALTAQDCGLQPG